MIKQKSLSSNKKVHTCKFCNKEFEKVSSLSTHLLVHKRCPHMCNVCNKLFSQQKQFTDHILSHNGGNRNECKKCRRIFSLTATLIKHLLSDSCSNHNALCCKVCNEEFFERKLYLSHLQMHNAQKKPIGSICCKVCNEEFSERKLFLLHMQTHVGRKEPISYICCQFCNEKFFERKLFLLHMQTHDGQNKPIDDPTAFQMKLVCDQMPAPPKIQISEVIGQSNSLYDTSTPVLITGSSYSESRVEAAVHSYTDWQTCKMQPINEVSGFGATVEIEKLDDYILPDCEGTQTQLINGVSGFGATIKTEKLDDHSIKDKIVFECELCNEVFPQESEYAFHLLVHANDQHFTGEVSAFRKDM